MAAAASHKENGETPVNNNSKNPFTATAPAPPAEEPTPETIDQNNYTRAIAMQALPHRAYYPPGYRFVPTDEELILEYLKRKVNNELIPIAEMSDVNLYQYNPEALAENYPQLGENEWYFFTPRDRKYRNGSRPNRSAGSGYWKATGADKTVTDNENKIVGFRKALVFYEGRPPKGDKTNWIMHEYRMDQPPRCKRNANDMRLDDWVLCRIYEKASKPERNNNNNKQEQDHSAANDDEQQINNPEGSDAPTPTAENHLEDLPGPIISTDDRILNVCNAEDLASIVNNNIQDEDHINYSDQDYCSSLLGDINIVNIGCPSIIDVGIGDLYDQHDHHLHNQYNQLQRTYSGSGTQLGHGGPGESLFDAVLLSNNRVIPQPVPPYFNSSFPPNIYPYVKHDFNMKVEDCCYFDGPQSNNLEDVGQPPKRRRL